MNEKLMHWAMLGLFGVAVLIAGCGGGGGGGGSPSPKLLILHTNDLHSYLMGHGPEADYSPLATGNDTTVGGFARLATAIGRERAAAGSAPVLLLDAGDFMMGTPFEALGLSASVELVEMGAMGYDAITLGNHEFDWQPRGLAGIIGAAAQRGFSVPILATNLQYDSISQADDDLQRLESIGVIQRRLIRRLPNGLRVGIFGMMGKGAAQVATSAPVTFADQLVTARATVDQLRNADSVDIVILLSHAGIDASGKGEDATLAAALTADGKKGIDVIVSGHTHVALAQPVKVGNTIIVQAGEYGGNLGRLELQFDAGSAAPVSVVDYRLVKIDDSIPGDPATQSRIDGYINAIDALIAPLTYRTTVSTTTFDTTHTPFSETAVGDLVTDAWRTVVSALDGPVDIAIATNGEIRTQLRKGTTGNIWFADAFRILPLGIGPDLRPGYPLVTIYLTGKDLKGGMEVGAAAVDVFLSDETFLQVSGGTVVTYSPAAPPFRRVTSIKVANVEVDLADTTKCYKVVSSLFLAGLMSQVGALTGGAVSVTPKQPDCKTPVIDPTSRIVRYPPNASPSSEMKGWLALVQYLSGLRNASGALAVPAVYASPQGRIVR